MNINASRGNPDIKFPPSDGKKAIPFSRPGVGYNGSAQIDGWLEAPNTKTHILIVSDDILRWLEVPQDKKYVLSANAGKLSWIETTECSTSTSPSP